MRLIKSIEINYLRSLYSADLSKCGDLNIVFGRNDSGKSNLLRALNLFFNDKTDVGKPLDFTLDLSDFRRDEARKSKGRQFIWIKITFNVPKNFQKSLGAEVTIKRQWNRDGGVTETVWPQKLTGSQQAQLTKFRNQIDFSYIPAVKDLEVYSDLIERMYGAASGTPTLQKATSEFVNAIQGQTIELSKQLTTLFGCPANLAAPTEMSKLFRTLDFAHGLQKHSLLRQKGDGVKARHLPELLRFINSNERNKRLFIWAFEEPENSLDLGAADAEAQRFLTFAARGDTQVFITSHSPAFYLVNPINVSSESRRFFITKQLPDEDGVINPNNAAAPIDDIDIAETKMEDAGLLQLPYIIRHLSDISDKTNQLEKEKRIIQDKLDALQRPTLFVEGKHDKILFQSAFDRISTCKQDIEIQILGGTPKSAAELLKAISENGASIGNIPTFFLFDNDRAGRQAYKNICGTKPSDKPFPFTSNIIVSVLPLTEEFQDFLEREGILPENAFFTAEFLYPGKDAASLCNEMVLQRGDDPEITKWCNTIHGDYYSSIGQEKSFSLRDAEAETEKWLYARGIPDKLKELYANHTVKKNFSTEKIDSVAAIIKAALLKQ